MEKLIEKIRVMEIRIKNLEDVVTYIIKTRGDKK